MDEDRFLYKGFYFNIINADEVQLMNDVSSALGSVTRYKNFNPHYIINQKVITIPDVAYHDGKFYKVVSVTKDVFCNNDFVEQIIVPSTIKYCNLDLFGCYNLKKITVRPNNDSYCDIDGVMFSKDKKTLVAYPNAYNKIYTVPNGTTQLGNMSFKTSKVEIIYLPKTLRKIQINVFYGCDSLKHIYGITSNLFQIEGFITHNKQRYKVNPLCHYDDGRQIHFLDLIDILKK